MPNGINAHIDIGQTDRIYLIERPLLVWKRYPRTGYSPLEDPVLLEIMVEILKGNEPDTTKEALRALDSVYGQRVEDGTVGLLREKGEVLGGTDYSEFIEGIMSSLRLRYPSAGNFFIYPLETDANRNILELRILGTPENGVNSKCTRIELSHQNYFGLYDIVHYTSVLYIKMLEDAVSPVREFTVLRAAAAAIEYVTGALDGVKDRCNSLAGTTYCPLFLEAFNKKGAYSHLLGTHDNLRVALHRTRDGQSYMVSREDKLRLPNPAKEPGWHLREGLLDLASFNAILTLVLAERQEGIFSIPGTRDLIDYKTGYDFQPDPKNAVHWIDFPLESRQYTREIRKRFSDRLYTQNMFELDAVLQGIADSLDQTAIFGLSHGDATPEHVDGAVKDAGKAGIFDLLFHDLCQLLSFAGFGNAIQPVFDDGRISFRFAKPLTDFGADCYIGNELGVRADDVEGLYFTELFRLLSGHPNHLSESCRGRLQVREDGFITRLPSYQEPYCCIPTDGYVEFPQRFGGLGPIERTIIKDTSFFGHTEDLIAKCAEVSDSLRVGSFYHPYLRKVQTFPSQQLFIKRLVEKNFTGGMILAYFGEIGAIAAQANAGRKERESEVYHHIHMISQISAHCTAYSGVWPAFVESLMRLKPEFAWIADYVGAKLMRTAP